MTLRKCFEWATKEAGLGMMHKRFGCVKLSLLYRDNLTQPIQILLSHKQKTFSQYFSAFLKSTLNFERACAVTHATQEKEGLGGQ